MSERKPPLLLVAGPTASGKSALAAALAKRIGGVVINADSMQVYRGLPVLTAQPEESGTPHTLYAFVDPAEAFSAGKWLAAARDAIDAAWRNGKTPIVTGGTGMYFRSLLNGLADIPDIPNETRRNLQADYARQGETAFRARLMALDPENAAKIRPGDRQRLLRALEVVLATGKTLGAWQKEMKPGLVEQADITPILLLPPREDLYAACDRRFAAMLERGGIDEARALLARDLSPALPAMKIIGVREIGAYLSGTMVLDDARAAAQQATRNYAKRQVTWFKNQWLGGKLGFTNPVLCRKDFYRESAFMEFYAWVTRHAGV